jgi:hypothetical protein
VNAAQIMAKAKQDVSCTNRTTSHAREEEAAPSFKKPWMPAFLAAFAQGANITQAALAAQVGRRTVYDARDRDEAFAAGWATALEEAADRIRAEVHRRAIEGWEEPVFGRIGKDRDGQIGVVRKFDSGLLARLAVAHCPEFRDAPATTTINATIQITPEKLRELQKRMKARFTRMVNGEN